MAINPADYDFQGMTPVKAFLLNRGNTKEYCVIGIVACEATDHCSLACRGKCCWKRGFGSTECPHGKLFRSVGPTTSSKKYGHFISDYSEYFKDIWNIKPLDSVLEFVGDYVYIGAPFVNYLHDASGALLKDTVNIIDGRFIHSSEFTAEVLITLVTGKAEDFNGREIKDWSKIYSIKIAREAMQKMPNLVKEAKHKSTLFYSSIDRIKNDFVGMTAYIDTLPDGVIIHTYNGDFVKEGSFLVRDTTVSAFDGKRAQIRVFVDSSMTTVITDNYMVGENTKFKD